MAAGVSGDVVHGEARVIVLDQEEFFRRFDQVVPGDTVPGADPAPPGTSIVFERLSTAGLEEMHRYSTDERLYAYLEYAAFKNLDETRAYIEKLQQRMAGSGADKTAMYWFVRRSGDRRLVGSAGLVNLSYGRQAIEWGYGIDPELWGGGYVLQIQEMLKHYVFTVLELNRLHGVTMVENDRTIASVQAAGMMHEGTARAYYRKNDVYHDGWMYGMVLADYRRQSVVAARAAGKYTISDVIAMVASVLTEDEIGPASTNVNTPSWDSLNHMAIMETVADMTALNLSPSQIMRANSVSSLLAIINEAS